MVDVGPLVFVVVCLASIGLVWFAILAHGCSEILWLDMGSVGLVGSVCLCPVIALVCWLLASLS